MIIDIDSNRILQNVLLGYYDAHVLLQHIHRRNIVNDFALNISLSEYLHPRGTRQLQPHPPIFFRKVEIFIP